jgi:hypothetical protein
VEKKEDLEEWFKSEDGCLGYRVRESGLIVSAWYIHYDMFSLHVCSKLSLGIYDNGYDYKTLGTVMKWLEIWDGTRDNEPEEWFRNPSTGRRREYDIDWKLVREWVQY